MHGLEFLVVLGVTLLIGGFLANRWGVAPPVLLLLCGVLLGFVPALRMAHLPPDAVLLIFLPALLFWESLTTSLREIRSNLRPILLVSSGLVIGTAAAVAATAHALDMPWGPAWVLGAAVAPTDATAVGVLTKALPRRMVTVMRAESLINDGTALVLYGLAVGVTTGEESLGALHVTGLFALSYVGGAAAGLVVAFAAARLRRHLEDALLDNAATLLTPFVAFLLAEAIDASGVLAVVTAGLITSQLNPRLAGPEKRQQSRAFWSFSTYLLNGALFVLVGIEAQSAVRDLSSVAVTKGLVMVAAVTGVVIATRFAWLFTTPYLIRAIDRRPSQITRRVGPRPRIVSGSAGFRGAVSLAAALGVPRTVDSGAPFPGRDLIVFVTAGVIVVTLAQALVLPSIVRWARIPEDTGAAEEMHLAQTLAAESAFKAIPQLAMELDTDQGVVDRLTHEYEKHLRVLRAGETESGDEPAVRHDQHYTALRMATVSHKRETILQLHDERRIDDSVLRQLEDRLDLEELRLNRRQEIE